MRQTDQAPERPDVDVFGSDFVADPDPTLSWLRAEQPVYHERRTGLWLISRYADVRAALADPVAFRPDNALIAITPLPVRTLRVLARAGFSLPPTLANNGTATHSGLRPLVARFFTPARVAAAVPLVERLVAERLAVVESTLAASGSCDLVAELARDLPCRVLLEMLGLTGVDVPTLKAWSGASLELFWGKPDPPRQLELAAAAAEFHGWLADRVRSAQSHDQAPASDGRELFSALAAHRTPDGRALTVDEAVGVCYFLLIAGQETTTQLISTVFRRLAGRQDLWQRLAGGESALAQDCVEEVLRREPPVVTWRRVTSHQVRVAEVDIPVGAHVLLMLAGTGSDPAVFDEPEQFCPGRPAARQHLAFGYGRHFCLGAGLARMEAAVVLRTTAAALPNLRLVEPAPPAMLGLLSFRAPLRVVVRRSP